jgi:hypothetical protein
VHSRGVPAPSTDEGKLALACERDLPGVGSRPVERATPQGGSAGVDGELFRTGLGGGHAFGIVGSRTRPADEADVAQGDDSCRPSACAASSRWSSPSVPDRSMAAVPRWCSASSAARMPSVEAGELMDDDVRLGRRGRSPPNCPPRTLASPCTLPSRIGTGSRRVSAVCCDALTRGFLVQWMRRAAGSVMTCTACDDPCCPRPRLPATLLHLPDETDGGPTGRRGPGLPAGVGHRCEHQRTAEDQVPRHGLVEDQDAEKHGHDRDHVVH